MEESIPISDEVSRGDLVQMSGFETVMDLANEGTFLLAVPEEDELRALNILREFNPNAEIIGAVTMEYRGRVILKSSWGHKEVSGASDGVKLSRGICLYYA